MELSDPPPRAIPVDPTPSPQGVTGLVIAVVLLIGGLSSAVVWKLADGRAADRTQETADAVTSTVERAADDLRILTVGAGSLADGSGSVSPAALTGMASDLAGVGRDGTLAWLTPTTEPAGGWKVVESTGSASSAPGGDGALDPASTLPAGSDLAAAASAATGSGRPVITVVANDDGTARLAIVRPVRQPSTPADTPASPAGVVVMVDPPSLVGRLLESAHPGDVRYRVSVEDHVLAQSTPPPTDGVTRRASIDGQVVDLVVEDARPVDHDLAWFIMWITAVVITAVGVVGLRSVRYDKERQLTNALIGGTAELAQRLARAATSDDVAAVIGNHLPQLLGARLASFGDVDPIRGSLSLHHGTATDTGLAERFDALDLADVPGIADAVTSGQTVLLRSPEEMRRELPDPVAESIVGAGARAAAVLPLADRDGVVIAIVGVLWWDPPEFDTRTRGTLETVRELCEQSLRRAALTDRVSERASHLAELAERLTGVDDVTDAARTSMSMVNGTVGADAAAIAISDPEVGRLVLRRIPTADGPSASSDPSGNHVEILDADGPSLLADVVRHGEPAYFHDLGAVARRFPDDDPVGPTDLPGGRAVVPLRADGAVIGSMAFGWDRDVTFNEDLVHELRTVAEITAQSVRRAQLLQDRADEARRSRALAGLAQGLAARADTADVAEFLGESVGRPFDATHSVIGIVRGDQLVRRYSRSLRSGGVDRILDTFGRSDLADRTPSTDALREGDVVFLANREEAAIRYPHLTPTWEALEVHAAAVVPVRSGAGSTVATIALVWDRPVPMRTELRDALATVAGMVGQTLERTSLVDEVRQNAERFESLADLAQHLATVRTERDLTSAIIERAAPAVGATVVDVGFLDGATATGRATPAPSAALVGDSLRPRPDDGGPASHPALRCIEVRRAVVLGDEAALRSGCPGDLAEQALSAGIRSTVHVPLFDGDGRVLGVLAAGWDRHHDELAATITAKLRTLAELCSQTHLRVRLGEAEHRVVMSLQDRVVRPVPDAHGLRIAQRYLPASAQVGMGGDWFEGVPIDDHRMAVVVGDIAGHGIGAVVDMVELRAIVGSQLRSGAPLGEVYPRVTALLRQGGSDVTATSCTVVVDTATDSVSYASAGHLPPLLALADGRVELLEGGRQPLLGVDAGAVEPGTAPFPPGAVLVLYTDGIVERRREPIDESLRRLRDAVADLTAPTAIPDRTDSRSDRRTDGLPDGPPDVEHLADELLRRLLAAGAADDDVALVVISRCG